MAWKSVMVFGLLLPHAEGLRAKVRGVGLLMAKIAPWRGFASGVGGREASGRGRPVDVRSMACGICKVSGNLLRAAHGTAGRNRR